MGLLRSGRAEPDGLAVMQFDEHLVADVAAVDPVEGTVVEHVAVLVDLDQRRPAVVVGLTHDRHHVLAIEVVGPGHERGFGAQREADRVERCLERPERGGLGDLARLAGGRVLPLGEPVDLVVEQQQGEIHVAPERMDEVVAADREEVAVAADHPDVQIGTGHGEPGGDRRRPTVDRVHPVGVHVVREPGGTADAGDEDRVLPPDAQLGHQHLNRRQDAVVAATWAPPDLLVGLPVGSRRRRSVGHRSQASMIASSSSPAVKGRPVVLVTARASTRYSARSSRESCP